MILVFELHVLRKAMGVAHQMYAQRARRLPVDRNIKKNKKRKKKMKKMKTNTTLRMVDGTSDILPHIPTTTTGLSPSISTATTSIPKIQWIPSTTTRHVLILA